VTGLTNRHVKERFQRSGDTISKCFHRVLNMLVSAPFYPKYVHLPEDVTPPEILQNSKLYPFLKDCRGALDGSHFA
ncbi:hypothetical protein PLICRDRAFT_62804, partial [Plicaturopsis crispa FD-325 SS-3]